MPRATRRLGHRPRRRARDPRPRRRRIGVGPATVHADDDPLAISAAIEEHNAGRFPIVDDGELTGNATLDDLIATIGEELENVADAIEAQSPDYSP